MTFDEMINDLCRKASALAPRAAEEALDAGCTNLCPAGPRQAEAWRLIRTAFELNRIER